MENYNQSFYVAYSSTFEEFLSSEIYGPFNNEDLADDWIQQKQSSGWCGHFINTPIVDLDYKGLFCFLIIDGNKEDPIREIFGPLHSKAEALSTILELMKSMEWKDWKITKIKQPC
jgi:hypothetical protein